MRGCGKSPQGWKENGGAGPQTKLGSPKVANERWETKGACWKLGPVEVQHEIANTCISITC